MPKPTTPGAQLVALHAFIAPEGTFDTGHLFDVADADRAKFLVDGGYARTATKADAKEIAAGEADAPVA
ncbi:hypothetical protein [uncultured Xylophilus sp.]|uniref:hypothetical protein n=1 Tax=uncultured Xylophilus sp. TaxID=296832 RepID=UPI0025ED6E56|nr:hypothetical protein [uncultured Xylophilus sp.]